MGVIREVFILWHVHEFDDREDDEKLIGVYGTHAEAQSAIERLTDKPGFRSHPEGFLIDKYELGKDHWTEGYVTAFPSGKFSE